VRRFEVFKMRHSSNQDPMIHAIEITLNLNRLIFLMQQQKNTNASFSYQLSNDSRIDLKQKALKILEDLRTAKTASNMKALLSNAIISSDPKQMQQLFSTIKQTSTSGQPYFQQTPKALWPVWKFKQSGNGNFKKGRDDNKQKPRGRSKSFIITQPPRPCDRCGGLLE